MDDKQFAELLEFCKKRFDELSERVTSIEVIVEAARLAKIPVSMKT